MVSSLFLHHFVLHLVQHPESAHILDDKIHSLHQNASVVASDFSEKSPQLSNQQTQTDFPTPAVHDQCDDAVDFPASPLRNQSRSNVDPPASNVDPPAPTFAFSSRKRDLHAGASSTYKHVPLYRPPRRLYPVRSFFIHHNLGMCSINHLHSYFR
jgi:hypothetical protein